MATANLTAKGDILLQTKFRTLATKIRLKGLRDTTNEFSEVSEDVPNWTTPTATDSNPTGGGIQLVDPIAFVIDLAENGGLYETKEIQFLDSVNRTLMTIALPTDGTNNPTYSYYVNGAGSGTIRDGASGKYTLSSARIYFSE